MLLALGFAKPPGLVRTDRLYLAHSQETVGRVLPPSIRDRSGA